MAKSIYTFDDMTTAEQNEYLQQGCITPVNSIPAPDDYWSPGHTIDWYIRHYRKYCTSTPEEIRDGVLQGEAAYRMELRAMHERYVRKRGEGHYREELQRRYFSTPEHRVMKLEAWSRMVDSIFRECRSEYFRHAAQSMFLPFMTLSERKLMTRTVIRSLHWGDDTNPRWTTVTRFDWLKDKFGKG